MVVALSLLAQGLVVASQGTMTTISLHTRTITTTTTSATAAADTMFSGDDEYQLQGCFEGIGSGANLGFVLGGDYLKPANSSTADVLTVPICLELCSSLQTANNTAYSYVGVGNGRYVYQWACIISNHRITRHHG